MKGKKKVLRVQNRIKIFFWVQDRIKKSRDGKKETMHLKAKGTRSHREPESHSNEITESLSEKR